MRDLKDIFELTDNVLPPKVKKSVFFCEVEENAYEIFYYVWFEDGSYKQCYELVEEGKVEESILDKKFEKVASFIRETDSYEPEKRNVITLFVEGINKIVTIDKFDKSVGLYSIKKKWKQNYISNI